MAYRFWTCDASADAIYEHEAPNRYTLESAARTNSDLIDNVNLNGVSAMQMSEDGLTMVTARNGSRYLDRWSLSIAFDVSTATIEADTYDLINDGPLSSGAEDLYWKPDGTRLFAINGESTEIRWADAGTPWSPSTLPAAGSWSGASELETAFDQVIRFSADGTVIYGAEFNTGDLIREWSLSVAWDPSSTRTLGGTLDFTAQTNTPERVAFAPDGSAVFLTSYNTDYVWEYALSTPWDLDSASYQRNYTAHPGNDIEAVEIQGLDTGFTGFGVPAGIS